MHVFSLSLSFSLFIRSSALLHKPTDLQPASCPHTTTDTSCWLFSLLCSADFPSRAAASAATSTHQEDRPQSGRRHQGLLRNAALGQIYVWAPNLRLTANISAIGIHWLQASRDTISLFPIKRQDEVSFQVRQKKKKQHRKEEKNSTCDF